MFIYMPPDIPYITLRWMNLMWKEIPDKSGGFKE